MFELLVGVFVVAAIAFLAATAALIRPFRPFESRMSALRGLGLSLLCAVAAMFGAAILTETPVVAEAPVVSPQNVDALFERDAPPASRAEAGPTRAERVAAEARALAEARAAAEAAAAAATPAAAPAPVSPEPPAAEVGALMAAIAAADWKAAALGLADLRRGGYDLERTLVSAERAARAKVRGIPPDDPASARDGYLLLASIDPGQGGYAEKAEGYAAAADRATSVDPAEALVRRRDPDGTVWLEHPARPQTLGDRSTVLLAIGRQGEGPPWLEMRTVYSGRRWLFVDSVEVSIAGAAETLAFGWFERRQDAAAYEWRDERPDPGQLALLRRLAAAEGAILRFNGMQEGRDEPFPRADRVALAEMLAAWDALAAE